MSSRQTNGQPPHRLLHPDTLRAYRETHYRVFAEPAFTMLVDVHCPALAALHRERGTDRSAFVTACNPFGRLLGAPANALLADELERELARRGIEVLPGIGQHPDGDWPGEHSLLVPGIGLEKARALAARFDQNAFLWSDDDAVPRLILTNRA